MAYDPFVKPDERSWLALSEAQRIDHVLDYHRRSQMVSPSARLHAALHVTVENQLAEQQAAPVAALERLMASGIDRHEAIHAIASVAAAQMQRVVRERRPFDQAAYEQDLLALTTEDGKDSPSGA